MVVLYVKDMFNVFLFGVYYIFVVILFYFILMLQINIDDLIDCFIVILAVYFLHVLFPLYASYDIFHNYLFLFT